MLPIKKPANLRRAYKTLYFYTIRLPLIYLLIPMGFIFEFLITFPFLVLASLDRNRCKKNNFKK